MTSILRLGIALTACAIAAGCTHRGGLPDAAPDVPLAVDTQTDAAGDARDAVDTGVSDTGIDAVDVPVAEVVDAMSEPEAATDVTPPARCSPTVDGVIGTDWGSAALVGTNTVTTGWGVGLNELRAIHVCYDDANLYVGIDGTVESANAMVVYLDRDYGSPSGIATGISLFSALNDRAGTLDSRVSAALTLGSGVGAFGAEGAWGTAGMNSLASRATSDLVGLRLFWPAGGMAPDGGTLPDRRSDFAWTAGAQTACSPPGGSGACEVAIAWSALFEGVRPTSGTVALFARLQNTDGTVSSNQTLPYDNDLMPRVINQVLVLPYGP